MFSNTIENNKSTFLSKLVIVQKSKYIKYLKIIAFTIAALMFLAINVYSIPIPDIESSFLPVISNLIYTSLYIIYVFALSILALLEFEGDGLTTMIVLIFMIISLGLM